MFKKRTTTTATTTPTANTIQPPQSSSSNLDIRARQKTEVRNVEMPNAEDVQAGAVFRIQLQRLEDVRFDVG